MALEDLFKKAAPKWMQAKGPEDDIVIASRVRLARNIANIPFCAVASDEQLRQVQELVKAVAAQMNLEGSVGTLHFRAMPEVEQLERRRLVEKHLISPQHAQQVRNRAVALSDDETLCIMVNEEDHLRIQVLYPGLQLLAAYERADKTDDELDARLNFAFSEEVGYLTACPTNVGTGMRASLMMHLPALSATGVMPRIINAVRQLGLTVRGIYGEGTEVVGNIYQVSNQVSLGRSEREIIEHLTNVAEQILAHERTARNTLLESNRLALEDRIWRAYGVLSHSRILNTADALGYLSTVRLGIDLGIITGLEPRILQELMVMIRPAHLQFIMGRELEAEQRDEYRASLIRERLKQPNG
ncbi:MAG: protein arginine kinase [Firmicutes bacterium]|nr:protein arginine kinase [Bacillota bacterium]